MRARTPDPPSRPARAQAAARCGDLAAELGLRPLPPGERGPLDTPFDVSPIPVPGADDGQPADGKGVSGGAGAGSGSSAAELEAQLAEAEAAAAARGAAVRALKEGGRGNADPEVQSGVQALLKLKERAAALREQLEAAAAAAAAPVEDGEEVGGSGSSDSKAGKRQVLPDDHPYAAVAIWQLAPQPLFFEGPRAVAKELAKRVAAEVAAAPARR